MFNADNAEVGIAAVMSLSEMSVNRIIKVLSADCIFMFSKAILKSTFGSANIKYTRTRTGQSVNNVVTCQLTINNLNYQNKLSKI